MNGVLGPLLCGETAKAIASDLVAEPEKLVPRRPDLRSAMGLAFRPAKWPADVRYHAPSRHRSVTQQMSANSQELPCGWETTSRFGRC